MNWWFWLGVGLVTGTSSAAVFIALALRAAHRAERPQPDDAAWWLAEARRADRNAQHARTRLHKLRLQMYANECRDRATELSTGGPSPDGP
jgi:hypothetical protein